MVAFSSTVVVTECLPSVCEAMGSTLSTSQKRKEREQNPVTAFSEASSLHLWKGLDLKWALPKPTPKSALFLRQSLNK